MWLPCIDYCATCLITVTFSPAASRDSSNLLAHEAAFALGQMQDAEAIPALESVLNDMSLHPIVRHELSTLAPCVGVNLSVLFICIRFLIVAND